MSRPEAIDPAYTRILEFVAAKAGLVFPATRLDFAIQAITRAVTKERASDILRYAEGLISGSVSAENLFCELTVGETYFFREPTQFDFIRYEALPALRRARDADHVFRAWSAGCASGEEAYSLAILFEEEGLSERAHVLGTDISQSRLTVARTGVYGPWSFRGRDDLADRYFRRHGRRFAIADRFLDKVCFRHLNFATAAYPSEITQTAQLDLILCRNVLMYFDADTARSIAGRLISSLADGGWLVLGPSDPPLPDDGRCDRVLTPAGIFYHRRLNAASALAPAVERHIAATVANVQSSTRKDSAARLRKVAPSTAIPALAGAVAAFSGGDYARALALVQPLLNTDSAACALQIRALANSGKRAEAEEAAQAAASMHPLCPEVHFLEAVLLLGQNRPDDAIRALRKVIYLDPTLSIAHLTLAPLLQKCGRLGDARRALRNGLSHLVSRAPDAIVPLSDGERAGPLAEAAKAQLAALDLQA